MISGIRRRFRPWFIVWITLMWCLLMGEFTWANIISGLLVGSLIVFGLPLPAMPIAGLSVHWGLLALHMLGWFKDLAVASVKVAPVARAASATSSNDVPPSTRWIAPRKSGVSSWSTSMARPRSAGPPP